MDDYLEIARQKIFRDRHIAYPSDVRIVTTGVSIYKAVVESGGLIEPEGMWGIVAEEWKKEYIPALNDGDIGKLALLMRNFFRNELGRGLVSHNRAIEEKDTEFLMVKMVHDLGVCLEKHPQLTMRNLDSPWVGNPIGLEIGDSFILLDTPRHISHALKIMELTKEIEEPNILEIGGGYGGVAYQFYRLMGDRKFKYVIIDFLPVLIIAMYFIFHSLMAVNDAPGHLYLLGPSRDFQAPGHGVYLTPIEILSNISGKVDLVYNANSFSEMPIGEIQKYVSMIRALSPKYLFLEANAWPLTNDGNEIIPYDKFHIPNEYELLEWNMAPWSAGTGRLKELVYRRR